MATISMEKILSRCWKQVSFQTCVRLLTSTSYRNNSNRAAITKIQRNSYLRTYPTVLVKPDGSTIVIRYEKPRELVKLPLDLSMLSEQERVARVKKYSPVQKIEVKEEIEDDFDFNKYAFTSKR